MWVRSFKICSLASSGGRINPVCLSTITQQRTFCYSVAVRRHIPTRANTTKLLAAYFSGKVSEVSSRSVLYRLNLHLQTTEVLPTYEENHIVVPKAQVYDTIHISTTIFKLHSHKPCCLCTRSGCIAVTNDLL